MSNEALEKLKQSYDEYLVDMIVNYDEWLGDMPSFGGPDELLEWVIDTDEDYMTQLTSKERDALFKYSEDAYNNPYEPVIDYAITNCRDSDIKEAMKALRGLVVHDLREGEMSAKEGRKFLDDLNVLLTGGKECTLSPDAVVAYKKQYESAISYSLTVFKKGDITRGKDAICHMVLEDLTKGQMSIEEGNKLRDDINVLLSYFEKCEMDSYNSWF